MFTVGNQEIRLSHQKFEYVNLTPVLPKIVEMENSTMIPLHTGSRVYINKHDILEIFTNKPALYTVRLIELVFGTDVLKNACMPDEQDEERLLRPLEAESFESVLSRFFNV